MVMRCLLYMLAVLGLAGYSWAGISNAAPNRVIRVSDYPAGYPCTPERLYCLDRAMGWGAVAYDQAQDVYTVNADLWVGDNDGTETYFQVGRANHTNETLVVNGNVVVYPNFIMGQHVGQKWWDVENTVNRLTIGDASNANVRASLKIGSAPGAAHALYIGVVPRPDNRIQLGCDGGQFYVYNGLITAAIQDKEHAIGPVMVHNNGRWFWRGAERSHVLNGATISWMAGYMTDGGVKESSNTVFENGGTALIPNKARHVGAIFRNLQTAILDYEGVCDVELVDCVFTNNECNWSLANGGKGIVTIDCQIAPPTKGDSYRSAKNPLTKAIQNPAWISRRHIVVEAVNEKGAAVTNAMVRVRAEQEGKDLIDNEKAMVGEKGKTPAKGSPKAILLTELIKRAGDKPDDPITRAFTFSIRVTAPGYAEGELKGFRPQSSWETVRIGLKTKSSVGETK